MSLFTAEKIYVNEFVWLTLSTYFATQDEAFATASFASAFHDLYSATTQEEYTRAWLTCNEQLIQRQHRLPVNIYELFLVLRKPCEHSCNESDQDLNNSDIMQFVSTNSRRARNNENAGSGSVTPTISDEEEEFEFAFDDTENKPNENTVTQLRFPKVVPLPTSTTRTPADGLFDDEFEDTL